MQNERLRLVRVDVLPFYASDFVPCAPLNGILRQGITPLIPAGELANCVRLHTFSDETEE